MPDCDCCVCFDIHDPDVGRKRYKQCKCCIVVWLLVGLVLICIGAAVLAFYIDDPETFKMQIGAVFTGVGCFVFIIGIVILALLCWVLNHDWGKSRRRVAPGGMKATSSAKKGNQQTKEKD